MTSNKTDTDSLWLSCTLSPENMIAPFADADSAEHKQKLNQLRDQIRNGTYRPSIGEIAINLVRASHKPDSLR